jgi:cytokinin dehydrogenase
MNVNKLRELIKGIVVTDEDALQDVSGDFGRLVYSSPQAVVAPASSEDVRRVVELANQEEWTVATRGSGHSQSGQSLSREGVLLDMMSLNRIEPVKDDAVWVGAGVPWGDLVDHLMGKGFLPPVLTNDLSVTVGGSLSIGGIGVASHRFGIQADNVDALEVVTGTGDLVTCSPEENQELFDAVRCGLGQFGVITRARLRLRRFSPNARTFFLLYDSLEALMEDHLRILRDQRFDFIEGWCSPCLQGHRKLGDTRVPFAEWFFPVQVTVEYADSSPSDSLLGDLKHYRKVYFEDSSLRCFIRRMEPLFQEWRETGAWRQPHPWMEVMLPWERASEYIDGVLKSLPPALMAGGGRIVLWPCRCNVSDAPMFVHPPGEFFMGLGIQPSLPRQTLKMGLSLLNKASDLAQQLGGKRYLSGWIEFDHARWAAHFGDQWPRLLAWKSFFDPSGVLNPGFIHFTKE